AAEVEAVLKEIPGCEDLSTEPVRGQPTLQIRVNQEQLARYGVSARVVLDVVEALGSKPLGDVIEDPIHFPLVVRLPESWRDSPEHIKAIPLRTPAGETVPLSRLANVQVVEGPAKINREWSKRRLTVQCNVRGRDLGSFVAEAQRQVDARVAL